MIHFIFFDINAIKILNIYLYPFLNNKKKQTIKRNNKKEQHFKDNIFFYKYYRLYEK